MKCLALTEKQLIARENNTFGGQYYFFRDIIRIKEVAQS
jgi:hypothetical protein